MLLVYLVALLALLLYFGTTLYCGRARMKYGVQAPAVVGHPDFERAYRVQQNTLEQLVPFLPSLFLFAELVNSVGAVVLGATWLAGRLMYAVGYVQAAEKRAAGFVISFVASQILLIGSMGGLVIKFIQG